MAAPSLTMKSISLGTHMCAVTDSGGAKCWGDNWGGALGNGDSSGEHYNPNPVDVVGLSSGVASISAGDADTCAVTTSGAAKCWGWNNDGRLGDGTTTDRATPVDVVGLGSGVAAIVAGPNSCAVTTSGALKCWGFNAYGQVGDGTTTDDMAPVDVVGLSSGVGTVVVGGSHTCALTTSGGVKCWGSNGDGQLGDGTTTSSSVPVDVVGLQSGVVAIGAGGFHTCAALATGAVECWGRNADGELGTGDTTGSTTPVRVADLSGAVQLSSDYASNCALTTAGAVKCWGDNFSAELGDGTRTDRLTPVSQRAVPVPHIEVRLPTIWIEPQAMGVPFQVEVSARDAFSNVIPTVEGRVSWSDLSGTLSPPEPPNLVNGVSTLQATVFAPYTGDKISATSNGATGESYAFNVLEPANVVVKLPSRIYAGVPFTVTAVARDALGKTLTGYNAPATWLDNSGVLAPAGPSKFVAGVSTTSATVTAPFRGDRIAGSVPGVSGSSPLFNVLGPFSAISIRSPLQVQAGQSFVLKAIATDSAGNQLPNYSGSASWSDLSGTLAPSAPAAFVNGVSSTNATVGAPFHADRITISSGSVTAKTPYFNVYGPFAKIVVRVTTPVTHGVPFAVKATATDSAGNLLPGYNAAATWSDLSGSLWPTTPAAFANGVSSTQATIQNPFASDRITVGSGAVSGQSGYFKVG